MIMDFIKNLTPVEIVTYLGFIVTLISLFCYTYKTKVISRKKISQKATVKNGISIQAGNNVKIGGINESESKS